MQGRHFGMTMARAYVYNKVRSLLAVFVAFEVLNHENKKRGRGKTRHWIRRRDERGYFNNMAMDQKKRWKGLFQQHGNGSEEEMKGAVSTISWRDWRSKTRRNIKTWCEWVMPFFNEYWATSNRILLVNKSLVGIKLFLRKKAGLALTTSHTQNCLALLPSFHPWWPWLRLLNCACAWSTNVERAGQMASTPLQHSEHFREQRKCWKDVEAKFKGF